MTKDRCWLRPGPDMQHALRLCLVFPCFRPRLRETLLCWAPAALHFMHWVGHKKAGMFYVIRTLVAQGGGKLKRGQRYGNLDSNVRSLKGQPRCKKTVERWLAARSVQKVGCSARMQEHEWDPEKGVVLPSVQP